MNKPFINYLILCAVATGSLISCKKTLLDQQPQSSLDATTAFTNKQAVDAGMIGIYSSFNSANYYGADYTILPELEGGNLTWSGSYSNYSEVQNRILTTNNVSVTNIWVQIYSMIDRANTIIAAIPTISDASLNKPNSLAEAKLLRAFLHFDLLRLYGGDSSGYTNANAPGIPYITTPTYTPSDAKIVDRGTTGNVFNQIIADVDTANLTTTITNGTVNKYVGLAFLARVQLYAGNFTNAEYYAGRLISTYGGQTIYGGLAADYASIYSAKNVRPESIFEIQASATAGNNLGFYYWGRTEVITATSLANAHETGDKRKAVNYNNNNAVLGIVNNSKYRQAKYTHTDLSDNIPLIRLAEMYLTRAEARVRKASPDLSGALADLNVVRSRAGLGNSTAVTASDILTAIVNERRIELAHECNRFFDLRRLNLLNSVIGVPFTNGGGWRAVWPIPQREIDIAKGIIKQNVNY